MKNILLILTLCILAACNVKQANTNKITINYGTSFGMCMGYCKKQISITASNIAFSANKNLPNDTPTKDSLPLNCNKTSDSQLLETLQKSVDTVKFAALPTVIGCPDCADGGKEWIEIENNGKKRKVEFEFGNPPTELKAIVAQLKPILDSFKEDCK